MGNELFTQGFRVIVVGPSFSLHQCGLLLEIAIKLFQLFVICDLITKCATSNVRIAKGKI
jgi:DNA-directed RNA polymerase beta' subunit